MRWLVAVALVVGIAFPASGARALSHSGGGSHGGGHSAAGGSGFHGGFSGAAPARSSGRPASGVSGGYRSAAPSRFAGAPRAGGPYGARYGASYGANYGTNYGLGQRGVPVARNGGARPLYNGLNGAQRSQFRPPYRPPYVPGGRRPPYRQTHNSTVFFGGIPWVGPYGGWDGYDFLDYPDGDAENEGGYSANSADPTAEGYEYGADPGYGQAEPPPPYLPAYRQAQPSSGASVDEHSVDPVVTLVFKDGRPREQIHNYILSRSTLSVLDKTHRDIAVEELDMAATEQVNRAAGVAFRLPQAAQ